MSYINPDFAIAKACFKSLLHTAINASFLLFPLATILSNIALQDLLYLQAEKAAKNKLQTIIHIRSSINIGLKYAKEIVNNSVLK